jgi:4-hydroxy-tetrahydrodipicolinate reductase
MPTRIGIAGITGRMGHLLAEEARASGAELTGGVGRAGSNRPAPAGATLFPDLAALAAASDVVIDFTNAATAQATAASLAVSGTAWVLGSSGLSDAEIMEMHHRQKVDAPSGTAVGMGRAVAKGRGVALGDVMESGRHGHTGARKTGAIGFAALRGGQVVGEHTLIFAAATEHIALTHRAFDRRAFATGAVRAGLWVVGRPPGLYSMMDVLGM